MTGRLLCFLGFHKWSQVKWNIINESDLAVVHRGKEYCRRKNCNETNYPMFLRFKEA